MDPRRLLPALTALACALVVVTVAVVLARPDPTRPPDPGGAVSPVPPASVPPASVPSPSKARPVRSRPASVLAAWDARRAAAWARGDAAALASLYVAGAEAGAADVRLLRDYLRRGLRVEGLTTQVLALRVAARSAHRLELVVTDRVVGAEAIGAGPPVALPVGRPSTRRVVLVRDHEGWAVAEARDQESAAASTSRTSSSSKS